MLSLSSKQLLLEIKQWTPIYVIYVNSEIKGLTSYNIKRIALSLRSI